MEVIILDMLSSPTLCNPMDCSTPGFPVLHHLHELTQIHVHRVGDAIQPSHPLSSPSPPAFNLSQCPGLFKWISSSHQVALSIGVSASTSVLPMNTQNWSKVNAYNQTVRTISSVQPLSCVRLFATPWTAAHQASLSITNSWSLLKLMSIESVMPSNQLILCHPLLRFKSYDFKMLLCIYIF